MPDVIDEIIRAAMERGEFDDLPSQSQPLRLDDDPHTPAHLRLAHKLLKENDLAPDWMAEGKAIDHDRDALLRQCGRARARLRAAAPAERAAIRAPLEAQAATLNRRILAYNLKAPKGVAHKAMVDLSRELA
jgi:hypothetical protein